MAIPKQTNKINFHLDRPDSYIKKKDYILKVKAMSLITPEDKIPIRPAYLIKLLATLQPFSTLLHELKRLSVPKNYYTDLLEADQPKLIDAVIDFIKSFNNAIKRGEFPAGQRGYYGLPLHSSNLPKTRTRDKLVYWSNKLINGEAKRVDKGFDAMSHPSIKTIKDLFETFSKNLNYQLIAIDAYINKENEIKLMQPSLDEIINKCICDTTTYYNHLKPSMVRKNCRMWAVKYSSRRVGKPIVFNVSIPINSTVNVAGLEVAPNTVMMITNTCDTELYICLSILETDACTIQNLIIEPGEIIKVKASDIGTADNDLVNITNPSTTREGSCTITV